MYKLGSEMANYHLFPKGVRNHGYTPPRLPPQAHCLIKGLKMKQTLKPALIAALLFSSATQAQSFQCHNATPGDTMNGHLVVVDGIGPYGINNRAILDQVVSGQQAICTSQVTDMSDLFMPYSKSPRRIEGDLSFGGD